MIYRRSTGARFHRQAFGCRASLVLITVVFLLILLVSPDLVHGGAVAGRPIWIWLAIEVSDAHSANSEGQRLRMCELGYHDAAPSLTASQPSHMVNRLSTMVQSYKEKAHHRLLFSCRSSLLPPRILWSDSLLLKLTHPPIRLITR